MNRPDNISVYDELDLKLGIKSSLPHVKSTIALAVLLWECADRPSELIYSVQDDTRIVVTEELKHWMVDYLADIYEEDGIRSDLISIINDNQLFKSQMEALIVAFELIWKLAKVSFVDTSKGASAERTGGTRYPKKLIYTSNADIINCLIESNKDAYIRVLMSWLGIDINCDPECEMQMLQVLTALSEGAIFKLTDGDKDIIFNQNSLYKKLLETQEPVEISGDKEAKGPLRILKSLLSDEMNPFLKYSNGWVRIEESKKGELEAYQNRVDTFLRLSATKVIGLQDVDAETEGITPHGVETDRISTGRNVLLYGVPGSGKSWTIEHEYCHPGSVVERLVFHPDYTNADFVGQILPVVDDDKQVTYEFVPGPFTTIIRDAYNNPTKEYVLIIEEVNRGNAPAIFGEVFQLLDRAVEAKTVDGITYPAGTSEYGITHKHMSEKIYGDPCHKVRIPSNLSIIGTMNTSDQNVFTLDTAFQRRWKMRLIENNFENVRPSLANAEILDTKVTWQTFCEKINNIIIGNKAKMASAEDKRLGVYFIHESDVVYDQRATPSEGYTSLLKEYNDLLHDEAFNDITQEQKKRLADIREALMQNRMFPEKVIKYLWDDAFKFNPEALFDIEKMESLEQVIRTFVYSSGSDRFKIFKPTVYAALCPDTQV